MTQTLLGVGLYTLPEAARLLHVKTQTLRRWADGYIFTKEDGSRNSNPVFSRDLRDRFDRTIITFDDLLELYMIKQFRGEGVSLQTIRAAAANASKFFESSHPFAMKQFETDGKRIFATLEGIGIQELNRSQMVIETYARPFFRKIEFENFEPLRYWPNGKSGHIVLDRQRSFGKPIDVKSGVPTYVLAGMARAGETEKNIASWYEVSIEAVRESIAYEATLKAA